MNGVMIKYSNKSNRRKQKETIQKVRNTNIKRVVNLGTFPDELYKTS